MPSKQAPCSVHCACYVVKNNKQQILVAQSIYKALNLQEIIDIGKWFRQGKPLDSVPSILGLPLDGVKLKSPKFKDITCYYKEDF